MTFALLLRRVVLVVGWALVLALLGVCLLHQLQLLDTSWEVAVIGVSPWLLLLAVPVLLLATVARRWTLVAAAAVPLACWCVWGLPDFWPVGHAAPGGPAAVRLFDANVSQSNRDLRGIGGEIRRDHAELVTLEELTPVALRSLTSTGVLRAYPYRLVDARHGAGGMGVWSTIPLDHLTTWANLDGQVEIEGLLHPPGHPAVRLDVVHVYAPVFGYDEPATWLQMLTALRRRLATQRGPVLVAGDFNATWDMRPFQRILRLGLADAAVSAGDGWQMTWPRNQHLVIPYLRIDHVLLSPQLTVRSYRLGVGEGSDHRPLLVDVAYRNR